MIIWSGKRVEKQGVGSRGSTPSHWLVIMIAKQPTSFRLSPEALALLTRLHGQLGLSRCGVIELALRALAGEYPPRTSLAEDVNSIPPDKE